MRWLTLNHSLTRSYRADLRKEFKADIEGLAKKLGNFPAELAELLARIDATEVGVLPLLPFPQHPSWLATFHPHAHRTCCAFQVSVKAVNEALGGKAEAESVSALEARIAALEAAVRTLESGW